MDLPLQGTLATHDTDSPSLLRCLTFRTGYRLDMIESYSKDRKRNEHVLNLHLGWLECGAHGSMRVDGLDRLCGQDPWWQATNGSDLGTVNRLKLCCGYFHLNIFEPKHKSSNHIKSDCLALCRGAQKGFAGVALASTAFLSAGQGRNCSLCDKDKAPKQHKEEPCIMLLDF